MSKSEVIELSVVIPCYNERYRLPTTLDAVCRFFDDQDMSGEVLVVDDGSSDTTAEWVRGLSASDTRIRLISYRPNHGKGFAVKTGMLQARGSLVLFMDADGSTQITELHKLLPALRSGAAQVAIGSRGLAPSEVVVSQSNIRRLAGNIFGLLSRMLVAHGLTDTQCGFKLFTAKAARDAFDSVATESAIFDIEALLLAHKAGNAIVEIPIRWTHNQETRIAYDCRKAILIFLELLKIKIRHRILWPVNLKRPSS